MALKPRSHRASIAGILTGVSLAGEFIFFTLSGYDPLVLNDPAGGLVLLQESGVYTKSTWRAMEALQMQIEERNIEAVMTDHVSPPHFLRTG